MTEDMTVTALYSPVYGVIFDAGEHGDITGGDPIQSVVSGDSAEAPEITAEDGWAFVGWDEDFGNVTSNMLVTAQYKQLFEVVFDAGEHGEITGGEPVQIVMEGDGAAAPEITAEEGWAFAGWDEDFENVTSDMTVTAQYVQTFTVTFLAGEHGEITGGDAVQVVEYGSDAAAPTVTPEDAYNFTGWDGDFTNVTSDMTVTAQYAVKTFTVTFLAGEHGEITAGDTVQVVEYGADAVEPEVTAEEHYDFTGWDGDFTDVTSDVTVTAQYAIYTFTVTFLAGEHGEITAGEPVQVVEYGADAAEPEVTAADFWRFRGWDGDFTNVTSDVTVEAVYRAAGDGSLDNPYEISRVSELEAVGLEPESAYVLANDIDLSVRVYMDAVIPDFKGSFDGRGFAVENLTVAGGDTNYMGLFGYLYYDSMVRNLCVRNCDVSGGDGVGGLAGMNDGGIVMECRASGSVAGNEFVGGLVGYDYASIVLNCGAECSVSGSRYVGGLVGSSASCATANCFSAGTVSGDWYIGGLVGMKSDSDITGCFWDTDVSGLMTSAGGEGKTTAEMQSQGTFETVGWDYVDESENGNMDLWYQPAGSYPRLYWQAMRGDVNCDGGVDLADFTEMAGYWLLGDDDMAEGWRLLGDANHDGVVDLGDFAAIAGTMNNEQ